LLQSTIDYLIIALQTITDIENVFQVLPFAKTDAELHQYFEDSTNNDARIQAWEISNISSTENRENAGNVIEWQHIIQIQGFLSLDYDDPNGPAQQMQTWIDAIKLLFLNDNKLGKTVNSRGALRHLLNQPDLFYNRLCHHSVFELPVTTKHAL